MFAPDRAALVAINPEDREEYSATQVKLLKSGGHILLSTLSYDQSKMDGPPHSVDEATVRSLYEPKGMSVKVLGSEPASDVGPGSGKFSALDHMSEMQFLLTKDLEFIAIFIRRFTHNLFVLNFRKIGHHFKQY